MTKDEVRKHATELHAELMQLDMLATSQQQRRVFKKAREYLQCAIDTGSNTALQLGSYWFAFVSMHVHQVQEAKRKGAEKAKRKGNNKADHKL